MKYAVKVPFEGFWLFMLNFVTEEPETFETYEDAQAFAEVLELKTYEVVEYDE